MAPWMMAMISGKRRVVTETYTSSTTWVCPLGVSNLITLTGKGVDGTADHPVVTTEALINVTYFTSGSGTGPRVNDWTNMQGSANSSLAAFNAGGTVSYSRITLSSYLGGTETLNGATLTYYRVVASTASLSYTAGWNSSGTIASSGDANISFSYTELAAPGASTTGFGNTYAGGAANTAATPVVTNNVPVVGGTSYSLVIPSGGSITLSYFR